MAQENKSARGSGPAKAPVKTPIPAANLKPGRVSARHPTSDKEHRSAKTPVGTVAPNAGLKPTSSWPLAVDPGVIPDSFPTEVFRGSPDEEESSPDQPLVKRVRVGKGKGKVAHWLAPPSEGHSDVGTRVCGPPPTKFSVWNFAPISGDLQSQPEKARVAAIFFLGVPWYLPLSSFRLVGWIFASEHVSFACWASTFPPLTWLARLM
ncbi:hypothetical protein RIF29_19540 [Crotalaria pallida]|uniref:Uncharacterized protein n=1 Tax=Crotalaria pallida TaxID=3830 RepID=A0AAN9F2H5_CROPI